MISSERDLEQQLIEKLHSLKYESLQKFVETILDRMVPLELGWKARTLAELALMKELYPLLTKRAGGREISGLSAYE